MQLLSARADTSMTSASIIFASFARRTLSAASSRSNRSEAVRSEQFDQLGARGVEHAQGAQLLKRFLIGIEGAVRDLDQLLALLRVGAIEQHRHKLCVCGMVGIANAIVNRLDGFRRAGPQQLARLLSHGGDHSVVAQQPPADMGQRDRLAPGRPNPALRAAAACAP